MRGVAIDEFGGREKLQLRDLAEPQPARDELLVRVKAAGVNPVDWKIREGMLADLLPHRFPIVLGWDAAGVVVGAGAAVLGFTTGDQVFAYCRKAVVQEGAYAEYFALPASSAAKLPGNASFEEAASVPLAALTAYQALFDEAGLRDGERVLIHAAAGGVGGFAVQLARTRGAVVWATASAPNHEYVRDLGADYVVDYGSVDFREPLRDREPAGLDLVLDCVGGDVLTRSADVLREGGRLVSIVDPAGVEALESRGVKASFVFVSPNGEQLAEIARLFEAGLVRTHLSEVLSLSEVVRAHELIESGHTRGKIVLTV